MAWVRIHDGAMQDMKVAALSDSAFRLWVRGLCYCQTALTDGLIPRKALSDMGAKRKDVDMLSTPQVSGRAPLWETMPEFGFRVHDYLDWNDCRDTVSGRKKRAKDRKAAWEAKRAAARANDDTGTRSEHVQNAVAAISQPNQTKSNHLPSEDKRSTRGGHRKHAFCPPDGAEGFCVPEFLHSELSTMLGSHGDGFDLLQWYVDTDLRRRQERPPVGKPLDWWRDELRSSMGLKGWLKARPRIVPDAGGPRDYEWMDECRELHGAECGSARKHDLRKALDTARSERAAAVEVA